MRLVVSRGAGDARDHWIDDCPSRAPPPCAAGPKAAATGRRGGGTRRASVARTMVRRIAASLSLALAAAACGPTTGSEGSDVIEVDPACDAAKNGAMREALFERVKDHVMLKYGPARVAMYDPEHGID